MSVDIKTIFEDMKTSIGLARQNVLSYFLATLGMLVLMGTIIAAVAIPFATFFVGFNAAQWRAVGTNLASMTSQPLVMAIAAVLILLPLGTLNVMLVGSIFGMSKEIIDADDTHAETAFSTFRHKGLSLGGAGLIMTTIIVLPQVLVFGIIGTLIGMPITGLASSILSIFSFVWTFITLGLLLMVIPGVLKNKSVQEAVIDSVNLARAHPDRVFGLLAGFTVLLIISAIPAIIMGAAPAGGWTFTASDPLRVGLTVWLGVTGLAWVLLLFPMATIAITRVYYYMTEGSIPIHEQESIPIV
ncbi:MAG: hypothetical protein K9W43_05415 [Candidatus Thorarchaeota archaeon]|nr:hypothetical protein [Candidatus Thorarchaeota archaeon]